MRENIFIGIKNRILQFLAANLPGAGSVRVVLHRWRGVTIGRGVFIGTDTIIETSSPKEVFIGDDASLSMRVTIIAHFRERRGVRIEREAFIGPGAMILPGVVIGRGAVVAAGSVVTQSVPARTMVQGNPASPIARCGRPLTLQTSMKEFFKELVPIESHSRTR